MKKHDNVSPGENEQAIDPSLDEKIVEDLKGEESETSHDESTASGDVDGSDSLDVIPLFIENESSETVQSDSKEASSAISSEKLWVSVEFPALTGNNEEAFEKKNASDAEHSHDKSRTSPKSKKEETASKKQDRKKKKEKQESKEDSKNREQEQKGSDKTKKQENDVPKDIIVKNQEPEEKKHNTVFAVCMLLLSPFAFLLAVAVLIVFLVLFTAVILFAGVLALVLSAIVIGGVVVSMVGITYGGILLVTGEGIDVLAGQYELGLGLAIIGITLVIAALLYSGATDLVPFINKKLRALLKLIFRSFKNLVKKIYRSCKISNN